MGTRPESVATLSRELLVGGLLYAAEQEDLGPVYFSRLVDAYEEPVEDSTGACFKLTPELFSKSQDMLMDQGCLEDEWERTQDGRHVRAWKLESIAKGFYKNVVEAYEEDFDILLERLRETPQPC